MDWIHCNSCGIQPTSNVPDVFRLTTCGHIFCQYCEKEGQIDECKICKNKDVNTIKLSLELKPEIRVYFQDPEVLASQLVKVIEFQKGHRVRFMQFLQKKVQKYNLAKNHIAKLEAHIKNEELMRRKLIEENKNLMRELESFRNREQMGNAQSPLMSLDRPLLQMNSRASQLIKSAGDNRDNDRSQQLINSPFSVASTPRNNYINYRNPNMNTPSTPLSFIGNSNCTPYSITSNKSSRSELLNVRSSQVGQPRQRQHFSMVSHQTPPNMNMLKIANVPPRNNNSM